MQVPDGVKEDVEDNVTWEVEQYIPFGIEDAELDFGVLHKVDDDDVLDVFVTAAHIDLVKSYMQILQEAKLIVKNVDLNIVALNNIFEIIKFDTLDEINEKGAIILDFGAQKTSIIVYKNDGPILTKEIAIGGVLITEEIQRQMGLSYQDAEEFKTSPDGNLPEEILQIINSQISTIMEELKKVLNFFISAGSSEQVGFCYVTGGSSRLPGLVESLQEIVGLEVEYLNPFDVIEVDRKSVSEEDLENIAYCGLTAMGLGLRAVK
jgi:type IV pilus assembly protein PilM